MRRQAAPPGQFALDEGLAHPSGALGEKTTTHRLVARGTHIGEGSESGNPPAVLPRNCVALGSQLVRATPRSLPSKLARDALTAVDGGLAILTREPRCKRYILWQYRPRRGGPTHDTTRYGMD